MQTTLKNNYAHWHVTDDFYHFQIKNIYNLRLAKTVKPRIQRMQRSLFNFTVLLHFCEAFQDFF